MRTFNAALAEHAESEATVAVVGASDGKFVIPLATAGHRVIAIERDQERLDERAQVVEGDLLALDSLTDAQCDAIWTTCSWHYSANHHRPLTDFVTRMQALARAGGLYGAEFMMPVTARPIWSSTTPRRRSSAHASPLAELQNGQFTEPPHPGYPQPHIHRKGLLLATRSSH